MSGTVDTFSELQQAKQTAEANQSKIISLEKINLDLESRLEQQAKQNMMIERECVAIERQWRSRCSELEEEIQTLKKEFNKEQKKSVSLRENLSRTERELYGILQKKYEFIRGGAPGPHSGKSIPHPTSLNSSSSVKQTHQLNWDPDSNTTQIRKPQEVQSRKVLESLIEFLGI